MQMISVASSNIHSIGYEAGILYVRFISNGSLYRYYNVPKNVFDGLLAAGSKGSYLHSHIAKVYPYDRIG